MAASNKVAGAGVVGVVGTFLVCCFLAIQSVIPGCAPQKTANSTFMGSAVPDMTEAYEVPPESLGRRSQPNYWESTDEITDENYNKLTEMVREYPELSRKTTRALWADFKVSRKEYIDIWRDWREMAQQTGHHKRKLLGLLIRTDPEP
ncbi:unnamed protein product, partial [marine sediment metagenome]